MDLLCYTGVVGSQSSFYDCKAILFFYFLQTFCETINLKRPKLSAKHEVSLKKNVKELKIETVFMVFYNYQGLVQR